MAGQYFLKIDGIEGESLDEQHKGEIELDSWMFGGAMSGPLKTGSGAGAGKFTAQDFQFTAKVSKASPMLFLACTTGRRMPKATMTGRKGGDRPVDYFTITLSDVMISSYQENGASGTGMAPMEQVSCVFTKIQLEYRPINEDGSLGNPVSATYDVKKARPTRARRR